MFQGILAQGINVNTPIVFVNKNYFLRGTLFSRTLRMSTDFFFFFLILIRAQVQKYIACEGQVTMDRIQENKEMEPECQY